MPNTASFPYSLGSLELPQIPSCTPRLSSVSRRDWETKASQDDIDLALEYRETRLPDLEQRAKSLNGIGARTIVCGLLECGWTSAEVLSSPTLFLQLVRKHLDKKLEIPTSLDGSESLDSPSQTDCNNDGRTVDKDFESSKCDRSSERLESKKRPLRTYRSSDKTCLLPADSVVHKKCRNMHSSPPARSGPSNTVASTRSEEVTELSMDAGSAGQKSDYLIDEDWMRLLDSPGRLPGSELGQIGRSVRKPQVV
ncbi:hypothetical protein DL98DRAFT_632938 [Cadophora sp. DSE1049]|nr:hypothetical protein DL98DRAFT_632938 [Cadophora sp. DSE1049]